MALNFMFHREKKGCQRPKVFHLISHFDLGGAERVAANIAESQSDEFEYHVVEILRGHSSFTGAFLSELQTSGVRVHRSCMPDYRFHFMAERIAAVLFPLRFLFLWMKYRPQVVHAHTETPDMCLWAFFKVFPWLQKHCRIVRTIHNTCLWTGLKHFGSEVERFYQRNNSNIAISKSVLECYRKEYGAEAPVIYNGVRKVRQEAFAGIAKGKTNVLFAGRLEGQKGISHLVYIIKNLQDMPQYHFHVVGNGKLRRFVDSELGNLPNVTLYDSIYGISKYLASFDYMLMPSEFEGLGLMSVEASFAGLPVICSDCMGLNETVPIGWPLVSVGNSDDEYMRIFRTVLPMVDKETLRKDALRFVSSRFSIEKMQIEYENVYKS